MRQRKYGKLRGLIAEKGYTHVEVAHVLGITKQCFWKKLNGKVGFKQKDIVKLCNLLGIDKSDIGLFFYDVEDFELGE